MKGINISAVGAAGYAAPVTAWKPSWFWLGALNVTVGPSIYLNPRNTVFGEQFVQHKSTVYDGGIMELVPVGL